jgi:hypothetical protein
VALWWLGAEATRRRRALALGGAAGAFAVVAVSWLVALTLLGGPHRPFAFGSTNGSAWNATFVYDGLDRVTGGTARAHGIAGASPRSPVTARRRAMALARRPAPPGRGGSSRARPTSACASACRWPQRPSPSRWRS